MSDSHCTPGDSRRRFVLLARASTALNKRLVAQINIAMYCGIITERNSAIVRRQLCLKIVHDNAERSKMLGLLQ